MRFSTEEEWQAAYDAAEMVIRRSIDNGVIIFMVSKDPAKSGWIRRLAIDVAGAVIRSEPSDPDITNFGVDVEVKDGN